MAKKSSTAAGTDASYKRFLKNVELYALGLDSVSADLRRYEYGEATSPTHTIKSTFELVEFDADHFDLIAKMTLVVGDEAESPLLNISLIRGISIRKPGNLNARTLSVSQSSKRG